MAKIKMVVLCEEPPWQQTRSIVAEPGAVEINLEGHEVHVRFMGSDRRRDRLGDHIVLAPNYWAYLVLDETTVSPPVKK